MLKNWSKSRAVSADLHDVCRCRVCYGSEYIYLVVVHLPVPGWIKALYCIKMFVAKRLPSNSDPRQNFVFVARPQQSPDHICQKALIEENGVLELL